MASTAIQLHPQSFACKCLNVRLTSADSPSPDSDDAVFFKINVGEDGIQVVRASSPAGSTRMLMPICVGTSSTDTQSQIARRNYT